MRERFNIFGKGRRGLTQGPKPLKPGALGTMCGIAGLCPLKVFKNGLTSKTLGCVIPGETMKRGEKIPAGIGEVGLAVISPPFASCSCPLNFAVSPNGYRWFFAVFALLLFWVL